MGAALSWRHAAGWSCNLSVQSCGFLLPFILILALVWERWQRRRVFITFLILFFATLIPFGLYLRSVYVYDPVVNDLISILAPIAALIGLYWMRWWVVRSPRTWFDRIGDHA
jgi:hypothetical protein